MAKIKLGARPTTFTSVITVPLLDGTTGSIEMTYRYRTKTEFGELLDALAKTGEMAVGSDGQRTIREAFAEGAAVNTDYILQVAEGWNLDEPFSRGTVAQLCDEIPAAGLAIIDGYRVAITEGRLKN